MATVSEPRRKDMLDKQEPPTDRTDALDDHELERCHADDLQAARVVVGLLTGVFMMGLLLYAFICWYVMRY